MSILALKDWRGYPEGREKYSLYLASREWAVLKEQVRARSGGTCERCRNAPGEQVHHQTYERKYAERLEDLVHLCAPCHEFLSGKRAEDPVLKAPARLMGRTVQTVYLAGKITGTTWRDQLVRHGSWSVQNDGLATFDLERFAWEITPGCLPLPDGRSLDLAGPYWRAASLGGHSCVLDSAGPHASVPVYRSEDGEDRGHADVPSLWREIAKSLAWSDLVFAWIDSRDCYGTLTEIAFASGLGLLTAVCCPPDFDRTELWMTFKLARLCGTALTPAEGWRSLWTGGFSKV